MSVNKVILIGRAGKDPDVRTLDGGAKVASLSFATTDKAYTLQNGTQVPERTEWHNLIFWNKTAENVEKYCSKGSLVGVEGRLRSRFYDNAQGQRVYVTEVVCDSVQFLETKSRDKYEEQQYHSQSTYNPNQYQQPQNQQQDSFMNENPPFNIMEEDIQF